MDINDFPPDDRERITDQYVNFCSDLLTAAEADGFLFDAITSWSTDLQAQYQNSFAAWMMSEQLKGDLTDRLIDMYPDKGEDSPEVDVRELQSLMEHLRNMINNEEGEE